MRVLDARLNGMRVAASAVKQGLALGLIMIGCLAAGFLVAGVGTTFVIGLVGLAAVLGGVLLIWRRPSAGAVALTLVLTIYPIGRLGLGQIPMYLSDLLVALTLVVLLRRREPLGSFGRAALAYLALWLPAWLVQIWSLGIFLEPTYGLMRSALAVSCLYVGLFVARRNHVPRIVQLLAVGTLVTSALAIVQIAPISGQLVRDFLVAAAPAFAFGSYSVYPDRAFAFFTAPTTLSGFLAVMVVLFLGLLSYFRGWARVLLLSALVAAGLALVATYSRQWPLAFAAGLALLGLLRPGTLGRALVIVTIAAMAAWVALSADMLDPSYLDSRFSSLAQPLADSNVLIRLQRLQEFFQVSANQPWLTLVGRGFAQQDIAARGLVTDWGAIDSLRAGVNDNVFFIEIWGHGLIAGIFYVALLAWALSRGLRVARQPGPQRTLAAGFVCALTAAAVLHLFDNYFGNAIFMKTLLWLLVGVTVGLAESPSRATLHGATNAIGTEDE